MSWYNPKNWLNLNAGIIVVGVIVALVFLGTVIVGLALWNAPLVRHLFPFLEISEAFSNKAIVLFTAGSTFGTLFLALTMIITLKRNRKENNIMMQANKDKEDRDRRERYLNEIIEWANDLNTRIYGIDILGESRSAEERKTIWILAGLGNKGKYILTMAEYIFGNRLKDSVRTTGSASGIYGESLVYINNRTFEIVGMPKTKIDSIVRELDEAIAEDQRNTTSLKISTTKQDIILQKHAESLRDAAITTLNICAEIKADLLTK